MFSPLEQFDMIIYLSFFFFCPIPLLNFTIPMFLSLILFLFIYMRLSNDCKLIPTYLQIILENFVKFIFNLVKQQIGKLGYKYFPFIYVLFHFILIMNLFSLLPFGCL